MTLRFDLSARQRKELIERGRKISIALPLPDDWDIDGDPLAFARSVLAVDRRWVREAKIVELPVVAPLTPGGDGLAGRLGQIAHASSRQRNWLVYRVVCVVTTLSVELSGLSDGRTQWPGAVTIDGERYPDASVAGEDP